MRKTIFWLLAITISLSGQACYSSRGAEEQEGNEEQGQAQGHRAAAVTLWTDRTELFMEYPPLVAGNPSTLVIHLTTLKTFQPVRSGKLTVEFFSGEQHFEVVNHEPARPGIYLPEVTIPTGGTYKLSLHIAGEQVEDRIEIGELVVYPNQDQVPHEEGQPANEEIGFLKEQQWNTKFRTEFPRLRTLQASISTRGEILPAFDRYALVPAPTAGFVEPTLNGKAPQAGEWVRKGQQLVTITPPATSQTSFADIRREYLQAKADYERAGRLLVREAVPERRLKEASLRLEAAGAAYQAVTGENTDGYRAAENNGLNYIVRAPIEGVIDRIAFGLGENIAAGQQLFNIIDPRRVRLEVRVPAALFGQIENVTDAVFRIESGGELFRVVELGGRLLSIGSQVDRQSRTLSVVFEMDNPQQKLKINMFAEIALYTGQSINCLSIPDSAILDDNGQHVVYLQTSGESFLRREIETGISDGGYTQVLSGISDKDRVVTSGAYQVRLASLINAVPSGHVH